MRTPPLYLLNRRKGGVVRWALRLVFLTTMAGASLGAIGAVAAYVHFSRDLPSVPSLAAYTPPTVSTFHGHDGRLLAEFTVERRTVVPIERMPRHLIEAFLATEDKRFFLHKGVDYRATLRAVLANYVAGAKVQGASTLTQQLAKTLVGNEKSYTRKAREAILARRMEHTLPKLEILALYLNQIYLGHGAYGVQAAAHNYFRKDVAELNTAEAAMLAGLPPQPGKLTPVLDPEGAKRRQRHVLDRMVVEGFLSEAEAAAAFETPLTVYRHLASAFDDGAPYFTEHARRYVQGAYGYDALNREGLRVHLTVDADRQRMAQTSLREGLRDLGQRQGYTGPLRHLRPAEVAPMIERMTAHYGGPEALAPERYYLGVVSGVTRDQALVRVGALEGSLPLRGGMSWAVAFDKTSKKNNGRLKDATAALAEGDVVIVRLFRKKKGPAIDEVGRPLLALSQTPPVEGAIVSFDPITGYVHAMVGGYDFDQSEYNRAFQGCRQPGSVFKPVVYSLALDRDYTLATPLDDTPITVYDSKAGFIWKPKNYDGRYKGDVLLYDALTRSMNLPAIRTIRHVTPKDAAAWAKTLGLSTPMDPKQSLVLGSSCVYPWEMVKVYGAFALRGQAPRTTFIKRIEDRHGRVLEDHTHFSDPWAPTGAKVDAMLRSLFEPRRRLLNEDTGYLVQTALRGVVQHGTAVRAKKLGVPAGGKTGTTDAYDAWFLGFTDRLVTGVWVGSDRNTRKLGQHETGGKVALPVWLRYMKGALDGLKTADFTEHPPAGIVSALIDRESGLLASEGNRSIKLPFKDGTVPTERAQRAGEFGGADVEQVEGRF